MKKETNPNDDSRNLREKAEHRLRGEKLPVEKMSAEDTLNTLHELRVHQIELEMQNEELRLTHEKLEESRSKYADLYDFAPVGYFTIDAKGLIIEANLTICQMLRVERRNLIKKPFHLYVDRESQNNFYLYHRTALTADLKPTCEITLIRKDKEKFHARLDSTPVIDGDKKVESCRVAVIDITERKKMEEAVRRSEERMQQALRISRSFTFEWQTASDQVLRSKSCANILNLAGDAAIHDTGQQYFRRVHPDDREPFVQMFRKLTPEDSTYTTEYRLVSGDGSVIVLEETGQASFNAAGKLEHLIGVSTDITERKQAEEELRDAHEKIKSILETMSDCFVTFDREWRYTYVNASATKAFHMTPEQLLGKKLWDLWPEAYDLPLGINFRRSLNENISIQFEQFYPEPLNRWFEYRCQPTPEGLATFFCDITERKKAEEEIRKNNEELSRFNRVAVGRELRMIQLKKEINNFCEQAGLPPRYPLDFEKENENEKNKPQTT